MKVSIHHYILCQAFILLFQIHSAAQGIRGLIKGSDGSPLPYASVFINNLKTGTSANPEGRYELKLPPGVYAIRVQNIGYKAVEVVTEVKDSWTEKDIVLNRQDYLLQEVQVGKGKEDFACTIMRKAIAKKKYHLLQYNSYEMKVYIKGTGELTKAPFFLKNKLKKEGININEAYTTESVSQIRFRQPDKIDEKVIAVRTKGSNNSDVSPAMFINQSFYRDKIAGVISPLSTVAFRWYKFTYEGSFTEGDHEVNKIRVTPRSKGDNVFEGTIFIIENEWAIHSLDLKTSIMGFPVNVRQNYAEVASHVWMPVTHRYQFSGNVLGFAGRYNYLASCRDYKVELNKDLLIKTDIADEKIEKAPEGLAGLKGKEGAAPARVVPPGSRMSRKQFYKMMDKYEKESLKKRKDPDIISERTFKTDSNATKRDSSYWAEIRSVPLTLQEQQGYRRDDSLAKIDVARISGKDSLNVIKKRHFNPLDLVTGGNYSVSPHTSILIHPTFTQFYYNTVEGFNVNLSGRLKYQYDSLRKQIYFDPVLRYGFAGRQFYTKARLGYSARRGESLFKAEAEGGRFTEQFNADQPVHPLINTFSSLLFRRNYMKIYEKTFGKGLLEYSPTAFLKFSGSMEWSHRKELYNQSDYSFFYPGSRNFTPNKPENAETLNTSFPNHEALILNAGISYRPFKSYRVYNGRKLPLTERSPELLLNYTGGINRLLGSDVRFDLLELGINHRLLMGAGGKLDFELRGGTFLNSNNIYFMDYKHFDGNKTILSSLSPVGSFRFLDYYLYSTSGKYFTANTHYQFRKLLLTRIPGIRYRGIKENIFFNYLKTSHSPDYCEIGYGLDNVFRLFRIEAGASFVNGHYGDAGLRIGIASIFKFSTRD